MTLNDIKNDIKKFLISVVSMIGISDKLMIDDIKTTLKEFSNVVFNVAIQVLILQESNFKTTLKSIFLEGNNI